MVSRNDQVIEIVETVVTVPTKQPLNVRIVCIHLRGFQSSGSLHHKVEDVWSSFKVYLSVILSKPANVLRNCPTLQIKLVIYRGHVSLSDCDRINQVNEPITRPIFLLTTPHVESGFEGLGLSRNTALPLCDKVVGLTLSRIYHPSSLTNARRYHTSSKHIN